LKINLSRNNVSSKLFFVNSLRVVLNATFDALFLEFTTSAVLSLSVGNITEVMNSNGRCEFRTTLNCFKKEKMMGKLKFGVLGAGFIGRVHMDFINKCEGAEVLGVYDPFNELAEKAVKDEQAKKEFATPEKLLADKDIDAVVVASPNKTHVNLAMMALEAGKHVIVEKPLALSGKDATRIIQKADETGLITMVPHQMRWNAGSLKLRGLIEKGELGDIYYGKTSWLRQAGIPGWGSWFTRFEESGGGPLIDIGVHMLDLALYQMGNPKPVSVYGSTYAEFGPEKKGLGSWGTPDWDGFFNVEDLASALIKMDNGATLLLEVSWAANLCPEDTKPAITLMGPEGGAKLDPSSGNYILSGQKFGECFTVDVAPQGTDARQAMIEHFVECVKENKQTIAPVYSGMVNNIVLDAIYKSAKIGSSVDIDWNSYL